MEAETTETKTLPCGHVFHTSCVTKHFKKSCLCPVCERMVPGARPEWLLGCDTLGENDSVEAKDVELRLVINDDESEVDVSDSTQPSAGMVL